MTIIKQCEYLGFNFHTCHEMYSCCSCGGNDCGCRYCFDCNACDTCKEDDE